MALVASLQSEDIWWNIWRYLSASSKKRLCASCVSVDTASKNHSPAWPPAGFTDSESVTPSLSS